MIELTPLDIRSKRGDFARGFRGYDSGEVDHFLELVADQVEALMRKNATLEERTERLTAQVEGLEARERAVQEALVTAQELRREITTQAQREAESLRAAGERDAGALRDEAERVAGALREEAERDARALRERGQRRLEEVQREIDALERTRFRAMKAFRTFLERALDGIEAEEAHSSEAGTQGGDG